MQITSMCKIIYNEKDNNKSRLPTNPSKRL